MGELKSLPIHTAEAAIVYHQLSRRCHATTPMTTSILAGTMRFMVPTIAPDKLAQLQASVKRYIIENLDADAGDLKARLMLDFCLKEVGAVVYNQAIADAQAYMQGRVADLDAVCYADEFAFWPRK